jgi:hypothetical protein
MLSYDTTVNTLIGGIKIKPSDTFHLSFDAAWNTAEAALDPFTMPLGEAFAAERPNQSFDFSQTYLNSDLDTTFVEMGVQARYSVNPGMYLTGSYRYLDYQDDAPYLSDTTGSVDYYGFGVGWEF